MGEQDEGGKNAKQKVETQTERIKQVDRMTDSF